ncbi:MAG TPA: hypothetical protein VFB80_13970, partial [Pirellulaceae bacterium]|nr:hypothetical protein [Pirellulaceae bacterium]
MSLVEIESPPSRRTAQLVVPLRIWGSPSEQAVPLSFGVPLPLGKWRGGSAQLRAAGHSPATCQTKVLQHWPDGSACWVLVSGTVPAAGDG